MKVKLKELYSLDFNLDNYLPSDTEDFTLSLRAMIGPEGSNASESFDIEVCTPRWLLENCQEPKWGRHMLIVPEYDLAKIREVIANYCTACEGTDWDTVAALLSRIGRWEFEDYRQ